MFPVVEDVEIVFTHIPNKEFQAAQKLPFQEFAEVTVLCSKQRAAFPRNWIMLRFIGGPDVLTTRLTPKKKKIKAPHRETGFKHSFEL